MDCNNGEISLLDKEVRWELLSTNCKGDFILSDNYLYDQTKDKRIAILLAKIENREYFLFNDGLFWVSHPVRRLL